MDIIDLYKDILLQAKRDDYLNIFDMLLAFMKMYDLGYTLPFDTLAQKIYDNHAQFGPQESYEDTDYWGWHETIKLIEQGKIEEANDLFADLPVGIGEMGWYQEIAMILDDTWAELLKQLSPADESGVRFLPIDGESCLLKYKDYLKYCFPYI